MTLALVCLGNKAGVLVETHFQRYSERIPLCPFSASLISPYVQEKTMSESLKAPLAFPLI